MLDGVDRRAQVRLEGQAEALGNGRRDVVTVRQHDRRLTRRGDCQLDRELGPTDSGRSADCDESTRPGGERIEGNRGPTRLLGAKLHERPYERLGTGIALDDRVHVDSCEVRSARGLRAIVHAEHAPTA